VYVMPSRRCRRSSLTWRRRSWGRGDHMRERADRAPCTCQSMDQVQQQRRQRAPVSSRRPSMSNSTCVMAARAMGAVSRALDESEIGYRGASTSCCRASVYRTIACAFAATRVLPVPFPSCSCSPARAYRAGLEVATQPRVGHRTHTSDLIGRSASATHARSGDTALADRELGWAVAGVE